MMIRTRCAKESHLLYVLRFVSELSWLVFRFNPGNFGANVRDDAGRAYGIGIHPHHHGDIARSMAIIFMEDAIFPSNMFLSGGLWKEDWHTGPSGGKIFISDRYVLILCLFYVYCIVVHKPVTTVYCMGGWMEEKKVGPVTHFPLGLTHSFNCSDRLDYLECNAYMIRCLRFWSHW